MKAPEKLISALRREKEFLIATHINPDGDAIGSALALSAALEVLGKKAAVYSRDAIPLQYSFLPGHRKFIRDLKHIVKTDPVLVLLDCNSPERAALGDHEFRRALVIDHHATEKDFGNIRWVDRTAAATGHMIFHVIKALGVKITREMAVNLYTAISIDTGTFRYSNTSADVLRTSAELVDAGAEPNAIADLLYETWDEQRFKLLLKTLATLDIRDGIAVAHITKAMFKKTGTSEEDTENFSNFPRMIKTVKISALFRELAKDTWKASLRSKGAVDVAAIAEQFGGGGHRNAAGFRIQADLATVRKALLKAGRKKRK